MRASLFGSFLLLLAPPAPSFALDMERCRLSAASLPAAFAECATLAVPENPEAPQGPQIELFVARIPSLTAAPAEDPLLLINGGPGGSSVDLYLQMRGALVPVLRDREIVLVDQRGTGRSLNGLSCEAPEGEELETADLDELRSIVAACLESFERDPRYFTTSVAVRDLELLREALGVEQWSVYGVSYGTRVAQHYLRHYPGRVRAMILDGVVPAEVALGPDIAPNAQAALDAIFMRCAASPDCEDRFGRLTDKFDELRERVARAPVELTVPDPVSGEPGPMSFSEDHLRAVVRLMSYASTTAALLPLVIDQAYAGNYQPLAGQAGIIVEGLSESISLAMHNSVVCTEDVPFATQQPSELDALYLGSAILDALESMCADWPRGTLDEDFKSPVESDRPVLLLSGELDPVTPPAYAERAIGDGLRNSRHLVAPAQGHGVAGIGCMPRLLREFLQSADPAAIDGECLAEESPMPFFLSFQGPAP